MTAKDIKFDSLPSRSRSRFISGLRAVDEKCQNPLESPFCNLTGKGWKKLYVEQVETFAGSVNTPRFSGKKTNHDIDGLYELVIGESLSKKLNLAFQDPDFCGRIDDAITLRGSVAHKGRPEGGNLTASQVKALVSLFCAAAAGVEKVVKECVYSATGILTWQVTKPVRDAFNAWKP